jgi:hypothetical protein
LVGDGGGTGLSLGGYGVGAEEALYGTVSSRIAGFWFMWTDCSSRVVIPWCQVGAW